MTTGTPATLRGETPSAPPDDRGAEPVQRAWTGPLRSAGARMLVLPVSAVLGIVVTRLVIENYGTPAFAQYTLLVGLAALIPFVDLGLAAAVMNAVSASGAPSRDEQVRDVLVTALRLLAVSATALALAAFALLGVGLWSAILGSGLDADSGPGVATVCVLLFALSVPLSIGQRILVGLRRNHVSIAVQGLQTPLVLAAVLLCLWWELPAGAVVAVFAYAATLLLSAVCTLLAARSLRPAVGEALRRAVRPRTYRGGRVMDVAWPMLVQMVAVPLAMQTDRLVLSHRAGPDVLAEYSLAAQMFVPIWAVVSAGGIALWPVFARARAEGTPGSPLPMAGAFGACAAVLALAVGLASPFVAQLASGGAISLGLPVVVGFAVLMVLQAVKYPLGMYLTDAPGLRYQALMIVLMLPVNVALSWYLTGPLGAAGPVVGSVVGVALFEVLANLVVVRRRLRVSRAGA
jgi:O-antigen/teichoic acid export membrane protein